MGIEKKVIRTQEIQDMADNDGISSDDDDVSIDSSMGSVGPDMSDMDSSDEEEIEEKKEPGCDPTTEYEHDEDLEDEVIKAIKAEKEKKRDHPPVIKTEEFIVDICFNPAHDLIALALITGDVLMYDYTPDAVNLVGTYELHLRACRAVNFDVDGDVMYSTGKDRTIMLSDTATGRLKKCYDNAHEVPVYSLLPLDHRRFVTGDDNGFVKMWDSRRAEPIFSIQVGQDYVSDMASTSQHKYLPCAGGDGILTAIDLRQRKIYAQSEPYDSEMTCMGLFRSDTKLLVGSSSGKMYLFNWKQFGLHTDEYVGTKQAISCMIPITQNIVVTSGHDGILSANHLFPHRQLGVVGQHTMPVEKIDIDRDGKYLASSSHNNDVKFWNISYFEELEQIIDVSTKQNKKKDMSNNLPSSKIKNASDFFSGLA